MLHQFPCESPGRIKLKSNSQRIFLKYSNIKSSLFSFCDKVTAIKNVEERINTFYWHITLSQEGRGKWSGEVISSSYLTGQNKCAQSTEIIENKETK